MLIFDRDKFNKQLKLSGLKSSYLAKKLGISKPAFWRRVIGQVEFKYSEMILLASLMGVDDPKVVFFSKKVS
jgi:hypothetical protein